MVGGMDNSMMAPVIVAPPSPRLDEDVHDEGPL